MAKNIEKQVGESNVKCNNCENNIIGIAGYMFAPLYIKVLLKAKEKIGKYFHKY